MGAKQDTCSRLIARYGVADSAVLRRAAQRKGISWRTMRRALALVRTKSGQNQPQPQQKQRITGTDSWANCPAAPVWPFVRTNLGQNQPQVVTLQALADTDDWAICPANVSSGKNWADSGQNQPQVLYIVGVGDSRSWPNVQRECVAKIAWNDHKTSYLDKTLAGRQENSENWPGDAAGSRPLSPPPTFPSFPPHTPPIYPYVPPPITPTLPHVYAHARVAEQTALPIDPGVHSTGNVNGVQTKTSETPKVNEPGETPKVKRAPRQMPPLPEHVDPVAWDVWCRHRQEIGHPVTPIAAKMQWEELHGLNQEEQRAAIRESINHGWRGLKRKWVDRVLRPQQPLLRNLVTGALG